MYTYLFLQRSPDLILPEGIAGSLHLVTAADVTAVVEPDLNLESLQVNDERLMQAVLCHDRVIRDLFGQATVLSLRFGTCFVSEEKLVEHLTIHAAAYLKKLGQLAGQAEFTLKLTPQACTAAPLPDATSGKAYFLAKKQQLQQQAEFQRQQQRSLAELQRAIAHLCPHLIVGEPREGIERFYLLAPRSAELTLVAAIERLQVEYPGWELSLGEALPPYHFV